MQEYDSVVFPIEAEEFSPEKSVKDRAYLPQALVIMARLNKPPTELRTIHLGGGLRSEEHTSELQSHSDLVCRLLLEKKKGHLKSGYCILPTDTTINTHSR